MRYPEVWMRRLSRAIAGVIWALCAFVLTACLDALPDPPAVNQKIEARSHTHGDMPSPPELSSMKCDRGFLGVQAVVFRMAARQGFDSEQIPERVALVRQAADPSPPVLPA